ncbi:MAG: apolipoprotein N-acyltransferase [Rhodoferax sp.]|nr:apolipoprotein N-acyltransferase [Rhodoferax sp.]
MTQAEVPSRGARAVTLPMAALLALLAGALQAASLAWPWGELQFLRWAVPTGEPLWGLQILSMSALVTLLLRCATAWRAAALGWLFALAWLSASFGWLYVSMHSYGDLSAVLSALAVLALAAALALYYALACACFKLLAGVNHALTALCFAALWLLAELARGQWLTGFGWGGVGYAHVTGPLQAWLAWLGSYGTGALAAAVAAVLALLIRASSWRSRMAAAGALAALWLVPAALPVSTGVPQGELRVTLLQGNIAQEEKFQPASGVLKSLRWYGEQLQSADGDLVITPETALPVLPAQLPDGYWQALAQRFASGEQAALVGMPLGDVERGYTNSVVGWRPGLSPPWRYDKHHLVPFGEFIPPLFRWFTNLMQIPLGDFERGGLPQPTFDWNGQRLAATICYENLFSEELATQFVDLATAPTLLLNVSNLGWFGQHLAMDQHLQIARARALEFDRTFLLATNTGRSAIVDHRGVVTHQIAPHTVGALHATVQGRSGLTPYARWSARWGQLPLWALALGTVAGLAWLQRRRALRC